MTIQPPAIRGLRDTQRDFDRYQRLAFGGRSPEFFALEMCGECGELANLEKKIWRDPARQDCVAALPDEAADIYISLMNYCNSRGIDLEDAVVRKLDRIEQLRLEGRMGPTA